MVLGRRLMAIADGIERGQTMADIGTDHGFLPLYLLEHGICPKVVMTDVSVGSLAKAMRAFSSHEGEEGASFRVGDGLSTLCMNEVNVVVIAGMGGVLITQILGCDPVKTLSIGKYILQPRNGSGKLRYWLEKAGFRVVSERLAAEGKHICEIIVAVPPAELASQPNLVEYKGDIKYEIPNDPACDDSELLVQFLDKKLKVERQILVDMADGGYKGSGKINQVNSRIEFLEERLWRLNHDATK
ncbi:MAG: class I SAM-dependent methyltransferase [Clostridiales bacterium]|nr:class I SAM-dependent methyltransferase [Clostridiales bacterium]